MKKFFTFLAGILISIGVQAVDQISMGKFNSWDAEKMLVAEGNVITYDANYSWVGGDVWLGHDLSAYEYVCIVLEDCQGDFKFTLEYEKIAGDENNISQEYQFSTGTKQVTFKLDPARKQKVNKIMLQNTSNGGTLDIGNLYAGSAAEFETALDLGTFSGWGENYDASTHVLTTRWAWDGGQWWLGEADYSEYVNFVVEFVGATCGGYVAVEYNNSIAKTESGYSAGATSVSVPIREEGASSVQKITINGDADAATITLGAAYFVRDIQTLLPQYVTKDLDLSAINEGWSSTYDADAKTITFTGEWGACGWWMARDLSDYSKVVAEFSEPAPANGVLKVLYSDGTSGEQGFDANATKVEYELTSSKKDVNEIYLQLAIANTLKIERIYLVKLNDQTPLSLAKLEYGWSSDYDAATKTISFTGGWGARGWNIYADCSDYTRVIVTFATPTTAGGVLKADYDNGKTNEQGFEAGANTVELVLDNSLKSYVKGIFLSTEFSGTSFEIASATFSRSAMTEGEYGNYHRAVTSGDYGTICLPYGAANYSGMTLYEIAYRDDAAKKIYLDEATDMEAGMPYIFHATSDNISVTYDNTVADYAHGEENGLYGIRNETNDVAGLNADKEEYIVYNNEISKCEANCGLRANRAYIIVSDISTEAIAPMPGRRRVGMGYAEENAATGVENINGGIAPMQEGTYDIMGRQINEPTAAGFYIVNGKKVLVVK
ncbi:MAG: hypothetical protein IKW35_08265 [Paludibacteraceae bacterium]|nr:hypothetical protein [Paludibacteraceae bacterium]